MNIEEKVLDPVCIRIGTNANVILSDGVNDDNQLEKGALFGGEHYGFILIVDYNGRQREIVYPTQGTIQVVFKKDGILKIYEENKRMPWEFDKKGKIQHSTFNEFTDEFLRKCSFVIDNQVYNSPILINPVIIKISKDPSKSVICNDGTIPIDYPLFPGAMLGTTQYGFVLMIETDDGIKEIAYPTQNRIDAVGIDGSFYGDLKVFEIGKYNPWLFTYNGILKEKGSYNPYSRRDNQFQRECYILSESEAGLSFVIKDKK